MAPPRGLHGIELQPERRQKFKVSIYNYGVQKVNVQPLNIFTNICQ